MNDSGFQQSAPHSKSSLLQRPWFQGATAFILSIPAGLIITQVVWLILNPALSLEGFFLQISLLVVANIFLLMPIAVIALFFALTGAIIAVVISKKYFQNLFRNMLILGTVIVIVADLIFFGI